MGKSLWIPSLAPIKDTRRRNTDFVVHVNKINQERLVKKDLRVLGLHLSTPVSSVLSSQPSET